MKNADDPIIPQRRPQKRGASGYGDAWEAAKDYLYKQILDYIVEHDGEAPPHEWPVKQLRAYFARPAVRNTNGGNEPGERTLRRYVSEWRNDPDWPRGGGRSVRRSHFIELICSPKGPIFLHHRLSQD